MKYRIYVDEVGNPDLRSSDNPNHRFLSLTGVIIELDYVSTTLNPQMESLKSNFFQSHPDDPVIFHRKEMMNTKPPFTKLSNTDVRKAFDEQLLKLMKSWEYSVISVCLDKKTHKEIYKTWRYDPYHYCLAVLMERFVFFLNNKKCNGDALAESRGGKEDVRLKKSYTRLWEQGSEWVEPLRFQNVLTSKQLKVKTKANNISGLQLADLIAHPSRNEILNERFPSEFKISPFADKIISILQTKYYQKEGVIFGKKFL